MNSQCHCVDRPCIPRFESNRLSPIYLVCIGDQVRAASVSIVGHQRLESTATHVDLSTQFSGYEPSGLMLRPANPRSPNGWPPEEPIGFQANLPGLDIKLQISLGGFPFRLKRFRCFFGLCTPLVILWCLRHESRTWSCYILVTTPTDVMHRRNAFPSSSQ